MKPMEGFPLYVGWLDAMQKAIERLEKGTIPPALPLACAPSTEASP
jgi:hypothetical protein